MIQQQLPLDASAANADGFIDVCVQGLAAQEARVQALCPHASWKAQYSFCPLSLIGTEAYCIWLACWWPAPPVLVSLCCPCNFFFGMRCLCFHACWGAYHTQCGSRPTVVAGSKLIIGISLFFLAT